MEITSQLTAEEKRAIIRDNGEGKEYLLAILHELQNASGYSYVDEETAVLVAEEVGMNPTRVYDIITFYAMLRTEPKARYVLKVCNSTPCHFFRSEEIVQIPKEELGVGIGETTEGDVFAYHYIPCAGVYDIGPVIKVKDTVCGNLDRRKIRQLLTDSKFGKRNQ